jgi:hypothetical protein
MTAWTLAIKSRVDIKMAAGTDVSFAGWDTDWVGMVANMVADMVSMATRMGVNKQTTVLQ